LFEFAERSLRGADDYQRSPLHLFGQRNADQPLWLETPIGRLIMRTIVLALSLIALAAPAQAAQKTHAKHNDASLEQKCRDTVGKEQYEGEGRGGGRLQSQRFGECMMGMPQ
jgi:uncharacterized low-complexity protein